jgi:hypothetical protein
MAHPDDNMMRHHGSPTDRPIWNAKMQKILFSRQPAFDLHYHNATRNGVSYTWNYHPLELSPPLVSGLGAELLTLPLLLPALEPSSALLSRNPVHRSASDSLFDSDSVKNSVDNEGVLGVRWNGDTGKRKLLFEAPGLARPACSFCSSVQLRSAAISCRIWNFLGSERSRARKCKKWFVTICLDI